MIKIETFLIILIMSSVPFALAHPDITGVKISGENGSIKNIALIGLDEEKIDDESVEFLSNAWFWENFISLLIATIVLVMAVFIPINYREDLS